MSNTSKYDLLKHLRLSADISVPTLADLHALQTFRRKWGVSVCVYDDGVNTGTYRLVKGESSDNPQDNLNWVKDTGGEETDPVAMSAIGDRIYTEQNYVINSETLTESIDSLDQALKIIEACCDDGDGEAGGGYEPKNSIEVDAGELQLVGDELAPGNNKVYGTDGAGAKGWKDDPAGGSATPEYNPINTVVYYADGKVKQVKTDIGGGLFIDKRVEYATTGDEIGRAILSEIKDESVSPAIWKSITYNYTDGVLTSTTVADIVAWTIII
jgi:hypothetical protein